MSNDFKRGFIIGSAMQPLYVVKGGEEIHENFIAETVFVGDTMSNEGYCENIEF